MAFPLVSLCGHYHANKDWYPRCVSSWNRIQDADRVLVMDDGTLTRQDQELIESFGYEVLPYEDVSAEVEPAISSYPALQEMREKSTTFRSLIDAD